MTWVHIVWFFLIIACPVIYRNGAEPQSIVVFGNIAKIFSLLIAGLSLTFTTNAYTPGERAKRAWTFLAGGMWVWFFAQSIFAQYKMVQGVSLYPSIADIFFVAAYLPLFAGLIQLISDFRSTGLPMGGRKSYLIQIAILIIFYAILFFKWLWPLAINQDPPETKFLNVGYPTCRFLAFRAYNGSDPDFMGLAWRESGKNLCCPCPWVHFDCNCRHDFCLQANPNY